MPGPIRVEQPSPRELGSEYVYNGQEPADLMEDEKKSRDSLMLAITLLKVNLIAALKKENPKKIQEAEYLFNTAHLHEQVMNLMTDIPRGKEKNIFEILTKVYDANYELHQFDFKHCIAEKTKQEISVLRDEINNMHSEINRINANLNQKPLSSTAASGDFRHLNNLPTIKNLSAAAAPSQENLSSEQRQAIAENDMRKIRVIKYKIDLNNDKIDRLMDRIEQTTSNTTDKLDKSSSKGGANVKQERIPAPGIPSHTDTPTPSTNSIMKRKVPTPPEGSPNTPPNFRNKSSVNTTVSAEYRNSTPPTGSKSTNSYKQKLNANNTAIPYKTQKDQIESENNNNKPKI